MKWKAEKWLFLVVFSYLRNNKNSRSYRCSNIAKTRVFRTFRLGLLENLTWWSNSEPGFGFYAKNYFGNIPQLLHNKTMYIYIYTGCVLKIGVPEWIEKIISKRILTKKGLFIVWSQLLGPGPSLAPLGPESISSNKNTHFPIQIIIWVNFIYSQKCVSFGIEDLLGPQWL